jgi:hypothetical protein
MDLKRQIMIIIKISKVNPVAQMTMGKRCRTNLVYTDDRMTSPDLANLILWRASITRGGGASDVACAAAPSGGLYIDNSMYSE